MWYDNAVILADHAISFVGGALIAYGAVKAAAEILVRGIRKEAFSCNAIRREFTSKIMLGLEFFVAADLIRTILEPTVNQVIVLGIIVGIRTVISYFLDKEIKGLDEKTA